MQRGHHFALVDEADNIFIDEARTPLIIASPTRAATPEEAVVYHWADDLATRAWTATSTSPRREEAEDRADRRRAGT